MYETTARPAGWGQIGPRHFIAVTALALVVGIVGAVQGTAGVNGPGDSDQLAFFFPSAQKILDGHPFTIYAVRYLGSYPNFNPPLSTVLIAPVLAIGQAFLPGSAACVASGYADGVACRPLLAFTAIAFMPFIVLLGVAALAALRWLAPGIGQGQALVAYAAILLSPLLWQDMIVWWHFEQPMMLFFLVAGVLLLQRERTALAGVMLGLALLSRTTAAIPIVALLALLALERDWRSLLRTGGVAALVALAGVAPFFLGDRADTTYSLLRWRSGAPIGNSIWSLFIHTPLERVALAADMPVTVLAAAALAWLAWRRLGVTARGPGAFAVLAIAALLVPMLSKTNWPYYALEPFVLLVIWEFATLQATPPGLWRWPVLSLAFLSVAATLGQFMGLPSVTRGGIVLRLMGLLAFGVMGAFALAAWQRLAETTDRRLSGADAT